VEQHVLTGDDAVPAMAGFIAGDRTVTTRLIAGEYPALAGKVPSEFTATALTGTDELAAAIKRLAVVAARDTPIHLAFGPGQIDRSSWPPAAPMKPTPPTPSPRTWTATR
jgi:DNA polymerase III subunit beta